MGYEHRIYVVRKTNQYEPSINKNWAKVHFIFNLGRLNEIEDIHKKYPITDCFIYDDCENEILEDKYGDPLVEIPINSMIMELKNSLKRGINPNVYVVLSALETIKQTELTYDDIVCLHYGH